MWSLITAIAVGCVTGRAGYGLLAFMILLIFEQIADHLSAIKKTLEKR